MSEDNEPDWLAEQARAEALPAKLDETPPPSPVEQIVSTARRFVWDTHLFKTDSAASPFQLAHDIDALLRSEGLLDQAAVRSMQVAFYRNFLDTATYADSVTTGGRGRLAGMSDGQIVVLVLVWLFAFVMPVVGPELASQLHTMLSDSYATFALALAVTWRIRDKHR